MKKILLWREELEALKAGIPGDLWVDWYNHPVTNFFNEYLDLQLANTLAEGGEAAYNLINSEKVNKCELLAISAAYKAGMVDAIERIKDEVDIKHE